MDVVRTMRIGCPYCGETIELVVDCSVNAQEYVEDCSVCCRPIQVGLQVADDGTPCIEAHAEDE